MTRLAWGTLVDEAGHHWRVQRLGPGVYEDEEGALHLVAAELLEAYGYADTEANRQMLMEAAREAVARELPGVRVVG